jgi:hypothetical protein
LAAAAAGAAAAGAAGAAVAAGFARAYAADFARALQHNHEDQHNTQQGFCPVV